MFRLRGIFPANKKMISSFIMSKTTRGQIIINGRPHFINMVSEQYNQAFRTVATYTSITKRRRKKNSSITKTIDLTDPKNRKQKAASEEVKMQEAARKLLSLQPVQSSVDFSKTEYKTLFVRAKQVIQFYTVPNFLSRSLTLNNVPTADDKQLFLVGPLLCHSLLTSVILPSMSTNCNELVNENITSVIDMCLRTVNCLKTLDADSINNKMNNSPRYHRTIAITNGNLAEEILRALLLVRLRMPMEQSLDERRISRKLLHLYNSTLDVWAKIASSQQEPTIAKEAAFRAERLLLDLTSSRNQNLVQHATSCNGEERSIERDSKLLLSCVSPDVISLNTVINAWSKCRSSQPYQITIETSDCEDDAPMIFAERAESILNLMQDLYDSSDGLTPNNTIQPDGRSYDSAIQTWSNSGHPDAPKRAMQLLDKMLERYHHGINHDYSSPFPSHYTFTFLLMAWANSKSTEAVDQAEALFERMLQFSENGHSSNEPDTTVFNNLLAVYSKQLNNSRVIDRQVTSTFLTLEKKFEYCSRMDQIATEMMTRQKCEPDGSTYGTIMRAWIGLAKEVSMSKSNSDQAQEKMNLLLSDCLDKSKKYLLAVIQHSTEVDSKKGARKNLNIWIFNDLIQLYGSALEPEKAEEIFHLAQNQNPQIRVNAETFERLAGALSDFGTAVTTSNGLDALKKAQQILYKCENLYSTPNEIRFKPKNLTNMYNGLIVGLKKHANEESSVERIDTILNRMIEKYVQLKDSEHPVITAYPTRYSFHNVLSSYSTLLSYSSSFAKQKQYLKRIVELIQTMEQMSLKEAKETKTLMSGRERAWITPNIITYNILLGAYSKAIKTANTEHEVKYLLKVSEDLFQRILKNESVQPDKYSYASMLNIITISNLSDASDTASRFLKELLASGDTSDLSIDTAMFNTALKAFQKDGDEKSAIKAENTLLQMEESQIHPDTASYSIVMSIYSKLGTEEAAKRTIALFRRLISINKNLVLNHKGFAQKAKPDIECFNHCVNAFSKIGTLKAVKFAETLLDDLGKECKPYGNLHPNTNTFTIVLKAYLQLDDPEAAENILMKMDSLGLPISETGIYFNWVVKKWGETRCLKDAERSLALLEKMISRTKLEINEEKLSNQLCIGFNTVMSNFSKANSEARVETIFRSMTATDYGCNIQPDQFSYSVIMDAWSRSKELTAPKKVKDLLDEMITAYDNGNEKLRPTTFFYNFVLKACSRVSKDTDDGFSNNPLNIAIETFKKMQSKERKVDMSHDTYSHMLEICQKNMANDDPRRSALLVKLFERCCEDGYLSAFTLSQFRLFLPKPLLDQCLEAMMVQIGRDYHARKLKNVRDFPYEWRRKVSLKRK